MATASASSSLCSSEEKTNGFKLMRLIIDGGTEALRDVFKTKHPGNLKTVLGKYHLQLQSLEKKKIITPPQWKKLYPPTLVSPNIKRFDISLLFLLLRNICGISAPIGTGWSKMPINTDISLEANIVRIKEFRNEFFGHIPNSSISATEFEDRWKQVSTTLVYLGISQVEIDRLKDEECGKEEVDRIRREWSENDTKVGLQLLGIKKMLKKVSKRLDNVESDVKSMKPEKHDMLNKHLNWCDFGRDIELLCQKWCKDTREWVFDQVSKWFNDTTSDNRAFIITGQPGMGKSVIAAVICERFALQLAASHFFQYNNDRYNNPKILLQSLAKQLSNVLPEYKKRIVDKVSGKEGQKLDDMNIQALFSMLFKEPLTGIDFAEKYLIVIDAVDESEREGKSHLVDVIADYLGQLPSFIRFLITTRPENHISKKFEKLNPMFLLPNDEENVKDIQRLFEEKLSQAKAKHISSLIEKCEGVMLFANYLLKIVGDCSPELDIDNLPTGIDGIYTSYFKRWEKEFKDVEVPVDEFFSFLCIMAAAKEPLPEKLVAKVFDSIKISPAIAKRKIDQIKNSLSILLVMQHGRLTFFHKSVKDWLVERDHEFQVDVKFGNETLANICAREMDELKKKMIKPPFHPAAEYALLYGIQHKLAGMQGESIKSFIDKYVTDLEILYASISVDVHSTFNNIRSLEKDIVDSSVPEEARRTVETLMLLIRKYGNLFRDFPQSFLQHVLNWGDEELSSKAASLLNYRYKDLAYFEHIEKDALENALEFRICTSAPVNGLAISPSEDYVVCWYDDDIIELFSVQDVNSLWTIKNPGLTQSLSQRFSSGNIKALISIIAFHPLKNVILPGQLDIVINLQGMIEPGPFYCNDINPLFKDCCFSNDNSKMATTYEENLTVWNLVSNESLKSFSSDCELLSVSFSANGRFLATSDEGGEVVVYDLERDYFRISKSFDKQIYFFSTFMSDSWYCCDILSLYTLRYDLSALVRDARDFYGRPLNFRAAAEFEDFFANPNFRWVECAWLKMLSWPFCFSCFNHDIALVWTYYTSELYFYRFSKLKEIQSVQHYNITEVTGFNISVNGKLIYTAGLDDFWVYRLNSNYSIVSTSWAPWCNKPFVPVTNGVFFCGKLHKRFGRGNLNAIPELWNSNITQRLGCFPELSGTQKCHSVSEEIVACVMTGQVCFFNVSERKIVSTTCVPQGKVVACSSKYHVLAVNSLSPSLWRDGKFVAELAGAILESDSLEKCIFSPSSQKLAISTHCGEAAYIFDVALAKLHRKVDFLFFHDIFRYELAEEKFFEFLDDDHLLCPAYSSSVCIINASSGNSLSCISILSDPHLLRVSRKADDGSILLCFKTRRPAIRLIKVWLPR